MGEQCTDAAVLLQYSMYNQIQFVINKNEAKC